MALKITSSTCTVCGACEFECPTASITMKNDTYVINAKTCTECDGDDPKCISVCPVENCIVKA